MEQWLFETSAIVVGSLVGFWLGWFILPAALSPKKEHR